eukprot:COSAG02_NODE_12489_length_1537_cov_2.862309_2_plen_235_part_01
MHSVSPSFEVAVLTRSSLIKDNVAAMGLFDWLSLVFSTYMVALFMIGELKDIELVSIAVDTAYGAGKKKRTIDGEQEEQAEQAQQAQQAQQQQQQPEPQPQPQPGSLTESWWLAFRILNNIRRWVFLPVLLTSIPMMIMFGGADALTVCMNTVALMFLMDVDNLTFEWMLPETLRTKVEEEGHIELDAIQTRTLARTKPVHAALIIGTVLVSVKIGGDTGDKRAAEILPFLAFGL